MPLHPEQSLQLGNMDPEEWGGRDGEAAALQRGKQGNLMVEDRTENASRLLGILFGVPKKYWRTGLASVVGTQLLLALSACSVDVIVGTLNCLLSSN